MVGNSLVEFLGNIVQLRELTPGNKGKVMVFNMVAEIEIKKIPKTVIIV